MSLKSRLVAPPLRLVGYWTGFSSVAARRLHGIRILMFHDVGGPEYPIHALRRQMRYLTAHFTSTAAQLGASERPFAIAVAVAASASFLTPIAYQTNIMVYGPGGYRFGDYARLGWPLTLLVVAVAVFLIPVFWSLE